MQEGSPHITGPATGALELKSARAERNLGRAAVAVLPPQGATAPRVNTLLSASTNLHNALHLAAHLHNFKLLFCLRNKI